MIRINLIPGKGYKRRAISLDLYLLVGTLAVSLGIAGGVFLKNVKDIDRLRSQITKVKQDSTALQPVYKEFLSLERDKKEVARRIAAVEKIKEGRAIAPRMLYDIPLLTRDNLWLRKLSKNEARFELEGRSVDNESVADFVERLSKLPYMKNVELKIVEDVAEADMTIKKFIVQGSVTP